MIVLASTLIWTMPLGEIDWEHPGIHRGNLITCAGSERVTDRVCSIKWNSGAPVANNTNSSSTSRLLYYRSNYNCPQLRLFLQDLEIYIK